MNTSSQTSAQVTGTSEDVAKVRIVHKFVSSALDITFHLKHHLVLYSTLKALIILYRARERRVFLKFEIIINVLVISFCFI